ncbi:45102_t:CDS:2 [Gigaspora margarita]|uniref:45102_t:CDS:1 n=1 Tax=Gigaspora margarita TaxID=4874 RepID=A0ABN7VUC1_GIGMA|nr:45102_t:CDS:2 [Gigaspora margarita]
MATTTKAKHRQLEKQQSVLLTDDNRTILGYYKTPSTIKAHLYNKYQITKTLLNKQPVDELKKLPKLQDQLTLYQSLENIKPHSKLYIQKLNNSLLRFIINSIQSLSIVEDFIQYLYDLDPKYKLPCKPVLEDKIDKVYHNNIGDIQQKISEINYITQNKKQQQLKEAQLDLINQQENNNNKLDNNENIRIRYEEEILEELMPSIYE